MWVAYPLDPAPGRTWVLFAWIVLGLAGFVVWRLVQAATPYDLYRSADIAAYRAKSAGGARTLLGVESQVSA